MQSDRDLEQRFAVTRAADRRHVPPFERVVAERRSSEPAVWLRLAIAAAVVLVVAVGTWGLVTPDAPAIAFTPGDMRMPTDYLLETLSYPRAGEIPRIGASDLLQPFAADGSGTGRLP